MANDVMIPPWVRPESPETIRMIDDATTAFPPAFGRGTTQRGIFADPRWGMRRRYRGLRSDEKAAILNALAETRGQFNILRVTPHTPIRGSMPATELLTNNTFANGTTGLTPTACTLSVSDRVLTLKASSGYAGSVPSATVSAAVSVTQYVPYVARQMTRSGRGDLGDAGPFISDGTISPNGYGDYGLRSAVIVPVATTASPAIVGGIASSGYTADDYVLVPYWSFARCALVDNGANALLHSDEINDAVWTKTNVTIGTDVGTAPDGTITAESLIETAATGDHVVSQSIGVSSGVFDVCFACAAHASTRTFCAVNVTTTGGSVQVYVNLSTGAISTAVSASGNLTNPRAYVSSMGGGWYYICVVARKTGSETTATAKVYAANVTGASSYTGSNGTLAIYVWRATLSGSSVPSRLRQTVASTVPTDGNQTGGALYTKGWPVSTSGLLLANDWFEINGELKQLTAPVNSDAAGLAYMQFRPGLASSPLDSDPIIIFEPFGRFIYPGGRELENQFGIYADCEMNLEEIYV